MARHKHLSFISVFNSAVVWSPVSYSYINSSNHFNHQEKPTEQMLQYFLSFNMFLVKTHNSFKLSVTAYRDGNCVNVETGSIAR